MVAFVSQVYWIEELRANDVQTCVRTLQEGSIGRDQDIDIGLL